MKPSYINSDGSVIEFETETQLAAYVAGISPTPDLTDYLKNAQHEAIGKNLVRELYVTLRKQNLTQAEEGDLLGRIYPVLGCLADGFIRGARVICNSIPVAGQFTNGRKNYLLTQIDNAIAEL